ncbi:MAG TPA: family 10 glycosylhydrolase, partial [Vicinamibacteria bacterium]|nr:family 10 glycosylhydrolase [Vicinamibacteria bacterium]
GSLAAPPSALPRIVAQAARGDGDVEGYYLSPSAPGVGEHLEAVVRELLRGYPVQGLHLDFIRYPGPDYDYSRPALEGFRRAHGGSDLVAGPAQDPAAWDAYRRDTLTALLVRIGKAAREEQPGIVVSAAVVPDEAQAVSHRYQHWPSWMARGLLDALCPMTYTPDSRIFRQQLEQVLTHVVASRPVVWAGIGAYRLPLEGILEKVRIARESGVSGVLLFSHESLLPSDRMRLRHEAFPAPDEPGLPGAGARALPGRSPR